MDMKMELATKAMAHDHLDVDEMIQVTERLTDLLYEEVALLEAMNISGAGQLQNEKIALTQVLESQKMMLEIHPELVDDISEQDRQALSLVAEDFVTALEHNIRMVAVAKTVNGKVVQAIMETLQEQNSLGVYTKSGVTAAPPQHAISLTLNQQA